MNNINLKLGDEIFLNGLPYLIILGGILLNRLDVIAYKMLLLKLECWTFTTFHIWAF